jgi:hypothetical protein
LIAFGLGLAGCSHAAGEGAEKHLPTVTVSYPLQREVTDYQDYQPVEVFPSPAGIARGDGPSRPA